MSDSEEEILVYASFEEGSVDTEAFQMPDVRFKIIGLESETPIAQLGENTYKGNWVDALGTKVLFEDDPTPDPIDQAFTVQPSKMFKYKCQTRKLIEFSRFFLKPKTASDNEQVNEFIENSLDLVQEPVEPETSSELKNDKNEPMEMG